METVRIHEKSGEEKIIYLGQLLYVGVRDELIMFTFVGDKSISFNKTLLGEEEFNKLKQKFQGGTVRIRRI